MARLILVTTQAFESCRDKPQYRLLVELSEARRGEELEIVGEDVVLGFDTLLEILEDEGFDYEILDRDDLLGTYRVLARKRG